LRCTMSAFERDHRDAERTRLAMDAIPLIRARLADVEQRGGQEPVASGRLAALWRAQSRAAWPGLTLAELRRYCLDMLRPRRALDEDAPDYLRGYREGFQLVLRDLRRLE
jgi:hypothetical protein